MVKLPLFDSWLGCCLSALLVVISLDMEMVFAYHSVVHDLSDAMYKHGSGSKNGDLIVFFTWTEQIC